LLLFSLVFSLTYDESDICCSYFFRLRFVKSEAGFRKFLRHFTLFSVLFFALFSVVGSLPDPI
jgi:hypothetical protein